MKALLTRISIKEHTGVKVDGETDFSLLHQASDTLAHSQKQPSALCNNFE